MFTMKKKIKILLLGRGHLPHSVTALYKYADEAAHLSPSSPLTMKLILQCSYCKENNK